MEAELTALTGKTARLHALLADPRAERPFFLWHLWFRHVLADAPEGRGGFDIVIANPPYVRPHNLPSSFKEELWANFTTFEKKADLYVCFFEQAVRLLAQNGQFSFIVSNGFLRLDSFERLREFLLRETKLQRIVDFSEDIFESSPRSERVTRRRWSGSKAKSTPTFTASTASPKPKSPSSRGGAEWAQLRKRRRVSAVRRSRADE